MSSSATLSAATRQNLLSLQDTAVSASSTRQPLSISALSLANTAQQGILQLLR